MAFILNVTYAMKPGLRAEFLREGSEHGIQKAVLAEEGCLQYQYFEAVDEPDKLLLVERARAAGTPILCCMGTGNKLDPTRLRISAIEKTSVCPLCRVMRRELRARGIAGVRVLWSDESPCVPIQQPPGSVSFVPPVAGMILAGQVVRELAGLAG